MPAPRLPDGGDADRHRRRCTSRRPSRSTPSCPPNCPGSPRFYTYASGVAEVGIGALLLVPRTRRLGALAAVALFLAVFPANVNMVRLWKDKPLPMRHRRDRPAAAAGPDDHPGAQDLAQRSGPGSRAAPPSSSASGSDSGATVRPDRT